MSKVTVVIICLLGLGVGFGIGRSGLCDKESLLPISAANKTSAEPLISTKKISVKSAKLSFKKPLTHTTFLRVSPETHDFGTVREGEARRGRFIIERPQESALTLGRIYSTCTCISLVPGQSTFPKDKAAVVDFVINTFGKKGTVELPLYIQVKSPKKVLLGGIVKIRVTPTPAKLYLTPSEFHLGSVRGEKTLTLKLLNLTKLPVNLKSLVRLLPGVNVTLDKDRVNGGGTAEIILTTPARGLPKGIIKGFIDIITDCPEHATISIPVEGMSLGMR